MAVVGSDITTKAAVLPRKKKDIGFGAGEMVGGAGMGMGVEPGSGFGGGVITGGIGGHRRVMDLGMEGDGGDVARGAGVERR